MKLNDQFTSRPGDDLPRIMMYVCPKKHVTVSVDVDVGITLKNIACGKKLCNLQASSSGEYYPTPYPEDTKPEWEWYRPNKREYMSLSETYRDWVNSGGLLIRWRTKAEPILHGDPRLNEDHVFWKDRTFLEQYQ